MNFLRSQEFIINDVHDLFLGNDLLRVLVLLGVLGDNRMGLHKVTRIVIRSGTLIRVLRVLPPRVGGPENVIEIEREHAVRELPMSMGNVTFGLR